MRYWIESARPNSSAPTSARPGCHRAKITSATAIHPRPPMMPSRNMRNWTTVRTAPPRPASAVPNRTPRNARTHPYSPRCRAAAGFSPIERMCRPQVVRKSRNETTNTRKNGQIDRGIVVEQNMADHRDLAEDRHLEGRKAVGPSGQRAERLAVDVVGHPVAEHHQRHAHNDLIGPQRHAQHRDRISPSPCPPPCRRPNPTKC